MKSVDNSKNAGFTVVELMVATVVFSSMLLLVTFGLIQITRIYYKGITTSRTQQTARSIMDEISQAIQFSGEEVALPASSHPESTDVTHYHFCTGSNRYTFVQGRQLIDNDIPNDATHETNHVIVRDARTPGSCSTPTNALKINPNLTGYTNPTELLGPGMRLAKLEITEPSPDLYHIDLRVIHGDSDLLLDPTGEDARCKSAAGSQFCAVSNLETTVQRRVE